MHVHGAEGSLHFSAFITLIAAASFYVKANESTDYILYIYLQMVTTSIYIVSGDISTLIESFSASLWVFIFLSFLSILIMRFTHKDDRRPFKV